MDNYYKKHETTLNADFDSAIKQVLSACRDFSLVDSHKSDNKPRTYVMVFEMWNRFENYTESLTVIIEEKENGTLVKAIGAPLCGGWARIRVRYVSKILKRFVQNIDRSFKFRKDNVALRTLGLTIKVILVVSLLQLIIHMIFRY